MFKGILLSGALMLGLMCGTAHALVAQIIHSGTNNPTTETAYPISQSGSRPLVWTAGLTAGATSGPQNGGWNLNTTITGTPDAQYSILPTSSDVTSANALGWALEVQAEVLPRTAGAGSSVVAFNYLSTVSPNYRFVLTRDSAGTLTVSSDTGSGPYAVPVSSGYHTYLVTRPAVGNATLFVDGTSAITGITGTGGPFGFSQVAWGDTASGTQGNANFALVSWVVPVPEPMAAGLIGLAGLVFASRRGR